MKLKKNHFEIFKKECNKWIKKFELNDWEIYIDFDEKEDRSRAETYINSKSRISTIWLYGIWNNWNEVSKKDIEYAAKHEVIHIFIGELAELGRANFKTEAEWETEVEKLVRKIDKLI